MSGSKSKLTIPNRVYYGLLIVCILLVLADLTYHKHVHFGWENWPGSYAVYGFAAFFLIVLTGKPLRKLLMRDEDYYDR